MATKYTHHGYQGNACEMKTTMMAMMLLVITGSSLQGIQAQAQGCQCVYPNNKTEPCFLGCADGYFPLGSHGVFAGCNVSAPVAAPSGPNVTVGPVNATTNVTSISLPTSPFPLPTISCHACAQGCKTCTGSGASLCLECLHTYKITNGTANSTKSCTLKPPGATDTNSGESKLPLILGAALGGVAVLVVVVVIVLLYRRRRRHRARRWPSGIMGRSGVIDAPLEAPPPSKAKGESLRAGVEEPTYMNVQNQTLPPVCIQRGHDQVTRYTRDPTCRDKGGRQRDATGRDVIGHDVNAEEAELEQLPPAPRPPSDARPASSQLEDQEEYYEEMESSLAVYDDASSGSRPAPAPKPDPSKVKVTGRPVIKVTGAARSEVKAISRPEVKAAGRAEVKVTCAARSGVKVEGKEGVKITSPKVTSAARPEVKATRLPPQVLKAKSATLPANMDSVQIRHADDDDSSDDNEEDYVNAPNRRKTFSSFSRDPDEVYENEAMTSSSSTAELAGKGKNAVKRNRGVKVGTDNPAFIDSDMNNRPETPNMSGKTKGVSKMTRLSDLNPDDNNDDDNDDNNDDDDNAMDQIYGNQDAIEEERGRASGLTGERGMVANISKVNDSLSHEDSDDGEDYEEVLPPPGVRDTNQTANDPLYQNIHDLQP